LLSIGLRLYCTKEKLHPEDRFYLDDTFYYILHMADGFSVSDSTLDIIDRKTGDAVQTGIIPDGCPVIYVTVYEDNTYFICLESSITEQYAASITRQTYAVYRFDGEVYEKLVGNIGNLTGIVFADGAVWYGPYAFTYFGAKEMPTGNGDETSPYDFCQYTDGSIARFDLQNAEQTTWFLPDADDGFCAEFLGLSKGTAIVRVNNPEKDFLGETYEGGVYKYRLTDDGRMELLSAFENSQP